MSDNEISALSRQLQSIYGYNRSLPQPFTLCLAGLQSAARIINALQVHRAENWVIRREDSPPWVAFDPGRLIYLSSDAEEPLTAEDVRREDGCVLVIGGLVDHENGQAGGSRVGAALTVARSEGIRARRLPIEAVCVVRKPSLTCLAVAQILAGFFSCGDWAEAVREAPAMSVAPLRKYVRWK